jgi:hypothetical protein
MNCFCLKDNDTAILFLYLVCHRTAQKLGFDNFGAPDYARLPSPMLQAPDLLKPKPEELTNSLSCA